MESSPSRLENSAEFFSGAPPLLPLFQPDSDSDLHHPHTPSRRTQHYYRSALSPVPRTHLLPPRRTPDPALPPPPSRTRSRPRPRLPPALARIPAHPALALALYFALSLALTLHNKRVLLRFPFPYTLTAVHAACGTLGAALANHTGAFVPAHVPRTRDRAALALFSVLYALNIAVSNVSLHRVTVPFHQVVRAVTPLFTIALSACLLRARTSSAKLIALVPVVAGVALATYGDYYCTPWGLVLTLLGTVLAALKTIFTNVLQSPPAPAPPRLPRLALHPLDLLLRTAPLAGAQCALLALLTGELARARAAPPALRALLANGALAGALNVASFCANRRAGALGMAVAANVKQALAVLLAVALFDVRVGRAHAAGVALTLAGGAAYAGVQAAERARHSRAG